MLAATGTDPTALYVAVAVMIGTLFTAVLGAYMALRTHSQVSGDAPGKIADGVEEIRLGMAELESAFFDSQTRLVQKTNRLAREKEESDRANARAHKGFVERIEKLETRVL